MIEKIFIFILGSCVGSFLNVCIHRLPKEKSIIKPSSFCPQCKAPIKLYDNIPILSYIFLRGKCRNCSAKISFRYPLVEFITALIFLVLYLNFGLSLFSLKFAFLFCLLIVVSFIDIDYHAIPAYLCLVGIAVGLVFSVIESGGVWNILEDSLRLKGLALPISPFANSFIGLLFGLGFIYLFKLFGDVFISVLLYLRKKDSIEGEKESLGLGDVDFMGMVGVFLGVKGVLLVFFLAPFLAVAYSISALIFKKSHLIPYLPYLSLATVIVFFWGNKILSFIF
jgi:leader peptidase (prepilin peptidase)/N-methyltransferase